MELLLTVGAGVGATIDVVAELDPFTPVAELCAALVTLVAQRGTEAPEEPTLVLISDDQRRAVDPGLSVFDAGILSGHYVEVVSQAAVHRAGGRPATRAATQNSVSLDVTSGPDAGRSVLIAPGRHIVGRAPDCDVVISDPSMSRQHFAITVSPGSEVTIDPNPETTNGTFVGTDRLTGPRVVRIEETLFAGSSHMVLRGDRFATIGRRDRLGQVSFNRLPYRRPTVRERKLEPLEAPPERPGKRRFSVTALLAPIGGAIAITLLTQQYVFLILAGLSPLMMVSNHISEGRSSRGNYARDKREFAERVEQRSQQVRDALLVERAERALAAPDVPLLGRQAAGRLGRLWERQRDSPDFLSLRIGIGTQSSRISTPIKPGGDPELREQATATLAAHRTLSLVPVTVDVAAAGVVGLYGEPEAVRSLGAAMITQTATLHSPEDLVIVAAIPSGQVAPWAWLKWLPHTRSATSPVEGAQLVDEQGGDDLVRRLIAVVGIRGNDDRLAGAHWPRVLFVCHEEAHVNRAVLATLLDVAAPAGVVTLWVGTDATELPRQCRAIVRCANPWEGASMLRFTDPTRDDQEFDVEGIAPPTAEVIARALAPVRDVSAATVTTGIPRVVTLFELPGLPPADGHAIAHHWSQPRPYGLVSTLGMGAEGPFGLDLVAEGPHALVAGTSGAGKSELLQTLVLSLAAQYPPERLNFLFIDYKGGAASAELGPLPHSVGAVTNLDERLALRALASLRAELRRRMGVLKGRAKDLADMLEVAPEEAPPSLVIVVDEFATLVKEIPDFVAGMVDVAQRGRSLGIHLVLATQRPTGAVNDNILANTNLRLALRVLDVADSQAVIDSRDAAGIPVPLRGRAYARTGPGALTPFQCAWSGAPYRPEEQATAVVVRRYPFTIVAGEAAVSPADQSGPDGRADTQLTVMVRACRTASDLLRLPPARRPWVEPLPDRVSLDQIAAMEPEGEAARQADPGRWVVVGLGDLPDEQRQLVVDVDLEGSGGLLVFGAGGSGKTTLLRTIAAGVARQGGPGDVCLFVLDFGGRSLSQLDELPHVVAAATSDDLERVTRMLTVLDSQIDRRRQLLADARAESLSALLAASGTHDLEVPPRLVVLLDDYAAFHATFEPGVLYHWITLFQRIVTDGRQVGIHVVMTTNRPLGLPTALTSAISARVLMRMASSDELVGLGVPRQAATGAELRAGRCFLPGGLELQVATISDDPGASAQAASITALADGFRAAGVERAEGLKELPEVVKVDVEPRTGTGPQRLRVAIGVADLTLDTVHVDLSRQNLVVLGPPLSGRSSTLATVAGALAAREKAPRLVGLGGLTSPLAQLTCWDVAGFGRSRQASALEEAAAMVEGDEGDEVKLVLIIDSVEDFESIEHSMVLESLVRSDAVRLVATAEPGTLDRAYSGWIGELKRNRAVLVLQPESALAVDQATGTRPALRPGQAFPPGRGVLVDHGAAGLIQVQWTAG